MKIGLPAFALVVLLAGCETGIRTAPPISNAMFSTAAKQHIASDTLAAGREIYIRRCSDCHSLQPMENYSPAKMRRIVDEMAGRAGLKEAEKQSLLDYLRIVRETM
jgi:mono/diheme cytochrome c family protein